MEIKDIHTIFLECNGVATDTRNIQANVMFVALKGERFDANTFTAEALEKGASYVIIDNPNFHIDHRTILVPDSLIALQELAQYHRGYLGLPIVALTGSNGKTSTKELIHAVLSQKFNVKATVGNLNNHIGVPLTLLSFNKDTEIGIVEMGANHQKEIAFLCELANPDFGYITNFGKAHLEGFGGIEGVIKGKGEMYDYLLKNHKTAFVNLDDPLQATMTAKMKRITFAVASSQVDIEIGAVSCNPFVAVRLGNLDIQSHMIGTYNANNINAAIAIGKHFSVADLQIKQAIEAYFPENNRSQLLRKGTNEIILDAYNANPSSMAAALENFVQLEKKDKIAFLGDMFELGSESMQEHRSLVESLKGENEIQFIFIGKDFYAHHSAHPNFTFFEDFEQLKTYLQQRTFKNHSILVKGSRGMALERILDFL